MQQEGKSGLRGMPLRAMAPNIVTMLALCSGLTGIRFALAERWEAAVLAIVVAGIFDGMDGTVARLLKATSRFGAELDSLSDIAAFGIAPAIVLYSWTLHEISGIGWLIALAYAVCCALRLARYNAQMDEDTSPRKQLGFLAGVPAPVGAGLALTPLMIGFWTGRDEIVTPALTAIYLAGVSFLMVSNLPTFSFRQLRLRRAYRLPLLVFVALFVALLTSYTWITLIICSVLYLGSLPLSWRTYQRLLERRAEP